MSNPIPLSAQKRLLRLISARTDMMYADDAFRHFMLTSDESARHHLFLAMVLAYCRPFTENYGIGSLRCEYPAFPDFPDADMNLRHKRFLDLRNKLLGHSSIEGTKVLLVGSWLCFTSERTQGSRLWLRCREACILRGASICLATSRPCHTIVTPPAR